MSSLKIDMQFLGLPYILEALFNSYSVFACQITVLLRSD
jgi:hypothetical protein